MWDDSKLNKGRVLCKIQPIKYQDLLTEIESESTVELPFSNDNDYRCQYCSEWGEPNDGFCSNPGCIKNRADIDLSVPVEPVSDEAELVHIMAYLWETFEHCLTPGHPSYNDEKAHRKADTILALCVVSLMYNSLYQDTTLQLLISTAYEVTQKSYHHWYS